MKKITESEYAAQQAKIAAELIQTGRMPTLEQLLAAIAAARENLNRKRNAGTTTVQLKEENNGTDS